ncbi:hypothetical protein CVT26_007982 [Gymnopilus dilepis]|uniref:Uncharacterized protein n=1 Tax=Gymnopilus dilepis TaxID=231916 RepID=A0A409W7M4_9AGAR|nr:hypothetical protein CVT26_007982 [Gymnopilus dilepis]
MEGPSGQRSHSVSSSVPLKLDGAYQVYTSTFICNAVLNKCVIEPKTGTLKQDPERKLAAAEYRKHKNVVRLRAKKVKAAMKAALAEKELAESQLILDAAVDGQTYTSCDLKTAVKVAEAARATLRAKEHLMIAKKKECEIKLAHIQDGLEEIRARLKESEYQYESFSSISDRTHSNPRVQDSSHSSAASLVVGLNMYGNQPPSEGSSSTNYYDFNENTFQGLSVEEIDAILALGMGNEDGFHSTNHSFDVDNLGQGALDVDNLGQGAFDVDNLKCSLIPSSFKFQLLFDEEDRTPLFWSYLTESNLASISPASQMTQQNPDLLDSSSIFTLPTAAYQVSPASLQVANGPHVALKAWEVKRIMDRGIAWFRVKLLSEGITWFYKGSSNSQYIDYIAILSRDLAFYKYLNDNLNIPRELAPLAVAGHFNDGQNIKVMRNIVVLNRHKGVRFAQVSIHDNDFFGLKLFFPPGFGKEDDKKKKNKDKDKDQVIRIPRDKSKGVRSRKGKDKESPAVRLRQSGPHALRPPKASTSSSEATEDTNPAGDQTQVVDHTLKLRIAGLSKGFSFTKAPDSDVRWTHPVLGLTLNYMLFDAVGEMGQLSPETFGPPIKVYPLANAVMTLQAAIDVFEPGYFQTDAECRHSKYEKYELRVRKAIQADYENPVLRPILERTWNEWWTSAETEHGVGLNRQPWPFPNISLETVALQFIQEGSGANTAAQGSSSQNTITNSSAPLGTASSSQVPTYMSARHHD